MRTAILEETQIYFGGFILTADDESGQLKRIMGEIAAVVHALNLLLQVLLILLPLLVRLGPGGAGRGGSGRGAVVRDDARG